MTNSQPLISVIIPFHNAADYLIEAIESVIEQSYQPIEIIAIDDGSTDKSSKIALSYKQVKYHRQDNLGPAAARNTGISLASADYIGFHDADDICEKERFASQMQLLLENSNLEVVYTRIINFIDNNSTAPKYMKTDELLQARMGFISSAVMRSDVFKKVGLFDESLKIGEDLEWIIRSDEKKISACSIPDVLIRRRLHKGNISNNISLSHKNLAEILLKSIQRRNDISS